MLDDGEKGNKEERVAAAPIVSIQTDKATILLKEYYGGSRTVAFRVPNVDGEEENKKTVNIAGDGDGNGGQVKDEAEDEGRVRTEQ